MPTWRLAVSAAARGDVTRTPPRRRAVAAVLVLLCVWLVLEALRPFSVLEVRLVDDDRRATTVLSLAGGDGFEVRYQHSYNHFTVRELFRPAADGTGVAVIGQLVDGEGAGIAEVGGETTWVAAGDGWSWLDGLDRSLDGPLRLRIGHVADHRLIHRCREVVLTDVGAPFTAAEVDWAPAGPVVWLGSQVTSLRVTPVDGPCDVPGPFPTTSTSAGDPPS